MVPTTTSKSTPCSFFTLSATCSTMALRISLSLIHIYGDNLYFSALHRGTPYICGVNVEIKPLNAVEACPIAGSPDKSISAFDIKEGVLALRWSTPEEPENLFLADVKLGRDGNYIVSKGKKVTFDNDEFISDISLGCCDRFQYRAQDGQELDGWLIHPSDELSSCASCDKSAYPMLTLIHGGPHGAYGSAFMLRAQMFAGRGYYAVSYTHLDVYKRQHLHHTRSNRKTASRDQP